MPMHYDYLVLGSGIAGLYAALLAEKHGSTCVLTKGPVKESNSKYAQGGIAAALGSNDDPGIHLTDTIRAGMNLCDPHAVEILVNEAPNRIQKLAELGVPFDIQNGTFALGHEAAHSYPRIIHAGGDKTGEAIETIMVNKVEQAGIRILDCHTATELLLDQRRVAGVKALTPENKIISITANWIILATGGAGRLYSVTTNPEVSTGDGLALAYRAGAALRDMEFIQFHPTALSIPGAPVFLLTEAMRGEGGILRNPINGNRFMPDYHSDAELAGRDIVSRAIATEMEHHGTDHVLLDISHLNGKLIMQRFPGAYDYCQRYNINITTDPIPVAPAAHYIMGGVLTDINGHTTIPGLMACGEVANNAVHGANRLASNSLLETVVFAQRAIESSILEETFNYATHEPENIQELNINTRRIAPDIYAIQNILSKNVGIVRSQGGLLTAAQKIDSWPESADNSDSSPPALMNMAITARIIIEAALTRCESRGAHFRSDFPFTDSTWERQISYRRVRDDI